MQDFQYYPTPRELANKVIGKFKTPIHEGTGVLDPSAGEGHLLDATKRDIWGRTLPLYACEIDPVRAEKLRSQGYSLIGSDFLKVDNIAHVSHVLMNPPFREGAKHVLHAWDSLWDGEIVAILNAETIRNPYTADRQELVRLIELHGEVEECGKAFLDPDTLRPADVDVVIVHLVKRDTSILSFDSLFGRLEKDNEAEFDIQESQACQELGFAKGEIEAMVDRFDAALESIRTAALAGARAESACKAFGATYKMTFADTDEDGESAQRRNKEEKLISMTKRAKELYAKRYDELKDRAWMSVYRMIDAKSMLSHRAEAKLMSSFESSIKPLAFTRENIYTFIEGIILSRQAMYEDMLLHVFDRIVQATPENVGVYRGWKSNGKHRFGMKLLPKRFILGGFAASDYQRILYGHEADFLADLDRAFAYLDGKPVKGCYDGSLENGFCHNESIFGALKSGTRWSFKYFDVRYYPKRGSIHFYPTRPELIDRINLVVGKHRQWIPENVHDVQDAFWEHYKKAEESTTRKAVWSAFDEATKAFRSWGRPDYRDLFHEHWDNHEKALAILDQAVEHTYRGLGYDLEAMMLPNIESEPEPQEQEQVALPVPEKTVSNDEVDEGADGDLPVQVALL